MSAGILTILRADCFHGGMNRTLCLLLTCAVAAGCATTSPAPPVQPVVPSTPTAAAVPQRAYGGESSRSAMNTLMQQPFSDTQEIDILYATNRTPGSDLSECDYAAYGVEPSARMSYGLCRVSVPKRHGVGGFEKAPNPRADPHKYFRSTLHEPLDENGFKERLKAKAPSDILVFMHGFNVKYEEAVLRSAQIAYDLKFQGPVVLFTWPAGSGTGLLDGTLINRTYDVNKANAANSLPQAAAFFRMLMDLGLTSHVMVHSMGHQVALPALAQAAAAPDAHRFIGELVLNAPDIPLKDFQRLAPKVRKLAERITVYCSYNDNAIAASESYNKGRRMGGCERVDGVDVVNVGEIDAPAMGIVGLGHSYYSSRPILTDLFQLLLGMDAERRLFIRKSEPGGTENFYLRP